MDYKYVFNDSNLTVSHVSIRVVKSGFLLMNDKWMINRIYDLINI